MLRKVMLMMLVLAVGLLIVAPASANKGKPDFTPHVYADGVAWGTKVTTTLPAPKGNNEHSFDKFFVFPNGADGQLPVGEAAPRNPAYNGGRWVTYTATWIIANPPVLKSYMEVMQHADQGHLTIVKGSPNGGPPPYFQCPLLPVK